MLALSDLCLFWLLLSPGTGTRQRPRQAKEKQIIETNGNHDYILLKRYIVKGLKRNLVAVRWNPSRIMSPQSAAFRRLQLIRASTYPPARFSSGRNPLRQGYPSGTRLPLPGERAIRLPQLWLASPGSWLASLARQPRRPRGALRLSLGQRACRPRLVRSVISRRCYRRHRHRLYRLREFQMRCCYQDLGQHCF